MRRLHYRNGPPDATDIRLVEALAGNARLTIAELARTVGLSAPSTAERVRRLEEAGVIAGYHARIAPEAMGYALSAYLRIRPLPGSLRQVAEIVRSIPEIVECDRVTGDDCFLARAHVRSVRDLERIVDLIIPHATTNTAIVQSSTVERRLPPLRAE